MSAIAFLGLGAMGSRMAARLLAAGNDVTVWNRTGASAGPLVERGARLAASPRAAAQGAEWVIAMVRDDEASRDVWLDEADGALAGMDEAAAAIDCSTLTVGHVRQLAGRFAARGHVLLDAPVAGSRPQAEAGALIFLVGGDAAAFAGARPLFAAMGADVHHAGPAGAGAALKLAVNALFAVQVAALGELHGMLQSQGVALERAHAILAKTPVCSGAASAASAAMLANAFQPLFPTELAAKDMGYALAAAGGDDAAPLVAATRAVFERAVAAGFGGDNLTGIVRLYR